MVRPHGSLITWLLSNTRFRVRFPAPTGSFSVVENYFSLCTDWVFLSFNDDNNNSNNNNNNNNNSSNFCIRFYGIWGIFISKAYSRLLLHILSCNFLTFIISRIPWCQLILGLPSLFWWNPRKYSTCLGNLSAWAAQDHTICTILFQCSM